MVPSGVSFLLVVRKATGVATQSIGSDYGVHCRFNFTLRFKHSYQLK